MTKHIVSETGERLKLLVDGSSGVPLFYPNLYSTSQIRGAAKSVATIQSYITSMKVLYSWAAEYSVDIEDRWKRAEWLKVWEIDSLRDSCSLPLRSSSEQKKKIVNIKQGRSTTTASVKAMRCRHVTQRLSLCYIIWVFGEVSCLI
ncbi:hypothetical protein [Xenorhabdus bovienii]|nr:hypothetical protein [Xenorhabdus bovienii]